MKRISIIAMIIGAFALSASPAMATHQDGHTPGPNAGKAAKAKAYGKLCQDQSKKHVKGEKGTPFSACVTAMAKVAKNERTRPNEACRALSKKHVKGEKGTPFSRCVVAAQKLKRELRDDDADMPGPKADHAAKAKAYGKLCQDQSKKHVKGEKGTPFSACVTAMAKVAKDERIQPNEACRTLSKEHVEGEKGTPFSQCVVAAQKLKRELHEEAA